MKIVLLENFKKLGSIGEVIDVKRGFARNYLILNNKALYASKENIKQVEKLRSNLKEKDEEKKKSAKKILTQIDKKKFTIKKLSTENKELYGSVKPTEISKIIQDAENIEIKPSMIELPKQIKNLGSFMAKINLHSEIQAEIHILVVAAEENAK